MRLALALTIFGYDFQTVLEPSDEDSGDSEVVDVEGDITLADDEPVDGAECDCRNRDLPMGFTAPR